VKKGTFPKIIGVAAAGAVIIPVLGCPSSGQGPAESKSNPAEYKAKMQQHGGSGASGGAPAYGRPAPGTTPPGGGGPGAARPGGGPPGPGAASGR
jgi:hypothetical protein